MPFARQQLFMAAALRNSALVKHHNLVRMTDGGKTVRNNQRGASYRQLVELLLYLLLRNIIERTCSLIQHYYRRIFEEDTRNRQALLLAAAQLHAALTHLGIVARRQLLNELIRRSCLRCTCTSSAVASGLA